MAQPKTELEKLQEKKDNLEVELAKVNSEIENLNPPSRSGRAMGDPIVELDA